MAVDCYAGVGDNGAEVKRIFMKLRYILLCTIIVCENVKLRFSLHKIQTRLRTGCNEADYATQKQRACVLQ
jgi:hypothetical protein